ncbi:MAG: phosphoribosylglycinamide formyltransferase [Sphingobacteriales bacterium]|nr:MAG: phosphoribosylglycinamide formyltransferase [Sphingobacteriales bacterium]
MSNLKKRIAIFASGSGSNAQKIMEYFKNSDTIEVGLILTNNPDAFVLQRADNFEIPSHIFDKQEFTKTDNIINLLENHSIDLIVLAGFLWLIPQNLLNAYPNKIINIHPSLLPKYGGKGMYGDKVHLEIMKNNETESGVTIHFVNQHFDEGEIIYQSHFKITKNDNLEMIKFKGQQLEHTHYPKVIEGLLKKMKSI